MSFLYKNRADVLSTLVLIHVSTNSSSYLLLGGYY